MTRLSMDRRSLRHDSAARASVSAASCLGRARMHSPITSDGVGACACGMQLSVVSRHGKRMRIHTGDSHMALNALFRFLCLFGTHTRGAAFGAGVGFGVFIAPRLV